MKYLFLLFLGVQAQASEPTCIIQDSFNDVYNGPVKVEGQTQVTVLEHNGFRYKLRNVTGGEYEIEVFDPEVRARTYARANLKNAGDYVSWNLWTRYASLDMNCTLKD